MPRLALPPTLAPSGGGPGVTGGAAGLGSQLLGWLAVEVTRNSRKSMEFWKSQSELQENDPDESARNTPRDRRIPRRLGETHGNGSRVGRTGLGRGRMRATERSCAVTRARGGVTRGEGTGGGGERIQHEGRR